MITQILIKNTQLCPKCKGKGEFHNPEWIAMYEALTKWQKANPDWHHSEISGFKNDYWASKGYPVKRNNLISRFPGTSFCDGPWEVLKCEECKGKLMEVTERYITIPELHELLIAHAGQLPS